MEEESRDQIESLWKRKKKKTHAGRLAPLTSCKVCDPLMKTNVGIADYQKKGWLRDHRVSNRNTYKKTVLEVEKKRDR